MNSRDFPRPVPYGGWPSPLSATAVAAQSLRLGQPLLHDGAVYWTETRPQESGRTALVQWTRARGCRDLVPEPYSVHSKVHEYGGGAFAASDDTAWFVNKHDQNIHAVDENGVRQLTEIMGARFADLVHDVHRNRLLAVCEQHGPAFAEPRNTLVAIDCGSGALTTLRSGADFYSSPRLSPDGARLAWLEWNHPDMPWDATRLSVAEFDAAGLPRNARVIAGGNAGSRRAAGDSAGRAAGASESVAANSANESVLQPQWRDNEEIVFASDRNDWWNLYVWRDGITRPLRVDQTRALCATAAEFALPHWVFGMRSFGLRDANTVTCACTAQGTWRLADIDLRTGAWRDIELPFTQIEHVHAADGEVVLHAAASDRPTTIVLLDESGKARELRRAANVDLDPAFLAPPEPVTFATGDGEQAHGLYYAPAHSDCVGLPGTTPPLLVKAHGGPTAATSAALDPKIRFWTSRGFAVLDVNYRGSTGYGRAYRHSLYGRWGIADVEDCINGARALVARGRADPERLLISGSSAGGFTALSALTFHDVFAAGASYYGIGDLVGAMRDTGKFESRYGDRLIGPLPETAAIWRARSPLFGATGLRRPVIFFQGLEDRVVPPDQSERMYKAAQANNVPTAYLVFEGEGHGFRKAETIATALRAEYAFYCRVLGIAAAEPLPELDFGIDSGRSAPD